MSATNRTVAENKDIKNNANSRHKTHKGEKVTKTQWAANLATAPFVLIAIALFLAVNLILDLCRYQIKERAALLEDL